MGSRGLVASAEGPDWSCKRRGEGLVPLCPGVPWWRQREPCPTAGLQVKPSLYRLLFAHVKGMINRGIGLCGHSPGGGFCTGVPLSQEGLAMKDALRALLSPYKGACGVTTLGKGC